jgi:hypothetical protein
MPMRRALAGAVLAAALLAGCGDDGGGESATPASETTTLDPGVTFDQDVTVPDAAPQGATTTVTTDPPVQTEAGEVPPRFPAGFPVPEGAEVEVGSVGRVEGELRLAVDYTIADELPVAVHEFYRDAVDEAGFTVLLDSDDGRGANYIGQMVFETAAFIGNVLVSGDGADGVLLTLTATLPD